MNWFQIQIAKMKGRKFLGELEYFPMEKKFLANIPKALWPFELSYSRTVENMKWDGMTKMKYRAAYAAGWNAAIFCRAKGYVMSERELEKIEKQNAKVKK